MKQKYNIICFGFLPWSNMWKRNQSMMAEAAKFDFIDRVIFVNPDLSLRHILKQSGRNGNKGVRSQLFPRKVHSGIWNYSLFHILPVSLQSKVFEKIESRRHLNKLRWLNKGAPYILFMNCPNIFYPSPLDELLKTAELSIFDFSDDFIELVPYEPRRSLYSRNIEKYAHAADLIFTVNDYLKNKYSYLNSNVHVIKNATNYSNFQREIYTKVPFLEKLESNQKPIIGYSGMCNPARIDCELLRILLISHPDWQFVFVGNQGEKLTKQFTQFGNFYYLPAVNYQELPNYLNYFKVTIVPFQINDHTKGNNLLKFHDYLSMGKPVVTTSIGGAEDLKCVLRIAETPDTFLANIEDALAEESPVLIQQRKRVAFDNAWPKRMKEVAKIIYDQLQ